MLLFDAYSLNLDEIRMVNFIDSTVLYYGYHINGSSLDIFCIIKVKNGKVILLANRVIVSKTKESFAAKKCHKNLVHIE